MTHRFPFRWEAGKVCTQPTKLERPEQTAYRVGEPFYPGRREWREGTQLVFSSGGPQLTIFQRAIGDDLVDDVRRGPAEFALIEKHPVIVLAYRFGESIVWNNVPYSWHLQPEPRRVIPSMHHSEEERTLLWITLVGAADGIILAQRGMTLSPAFTRSLHDAIRNQAMSPFNASECTEAISSIYLSKRSTLDLLAMATQRTMGNG
jgi:hypothetical protein